MPLLGRVDAQQPALVGRSEELAFCETVLARTESPGLVVTGAAGVGKTRLALELLRVAEAAGYATARATATEAGRDVPLGALVHVLPAEADAGAAPLDLLRSLRLAITGSGGGRPVALLVDDAHLLDGASAMLVQQLVTRREAVVIATIRTGEPAPDAVVSLWKDQGCEYLELQPLSLEESGVLVESLVGGDVDGETKHRLWMAGRGVPLVIRELVVDGLERRVLVEHNGLWRRRGDLQAGRRLLELIGIRIGLLDTVERAVLELVAIGEPLGWSLLDEGEVTAAEELMRRQLVLAAPDERRLDLRLAHPLFGESVRGAMTATRARAVERRLADALEATGLRRRGDLLRFAVWRLESGGDAPPQLLVRAANLSEWLLQPVLAERLARAAVAMGGGVPAERALARALIGQDRFVEADSILSLLAGRASTDDERVSVALAQARNLMVGFGRGSEAEAALAEAAQMVSDAALRRELELVRSWVLSRSGRSAAAAAASSALADDKDANDGFRLRAAGIAAHALVQAGRADDALALVDRWQPTAEQQGGRTQLIETSPLLRAQYRAARFLALLHTGRLGQAHDTIEDAYARSLEDGSTEATALMAMGCGLGLLVQGRPRSAQRWLREAVQLMREADPSASLPYALALSAQAWGQVGNAAAARNAARDAEAATRPGTTWIYDADILRGKAWAAAAEGASTAAQDLAGNAAARAESQTGLAAAVLAAHDLVRLRDAVGGSSSLTRLVEQVQGPLVEACAEHAAAVVSGEAERIEAAAARFAEMGAVLWAAEAESEASAAHRQAGREQSARAAGARAAQLLERCEGARTPALALAGPVEELTPREREIATLAAGGASNREIAERLVVSVRTVENNLQRAYGKLGIRNRRELAAALQVK